MLASIVDDNIPYVKPFPISIYHGFNKPSNSNDFLQNFIEESLPLLESGITLNGTTIKVNIKAIICDAPAKAFVTCVKSHTGYFGCTKCIQEGKFLENRVTFPELDSALRTDLSFKNRIHSEHHKSTSILESLGIGMVTQVPLDYMHLVCIGVTKRLIQFWVKGAIDIRMTKDKLDIASKHLLSLRVHISDDFARKPRSLEDIDRWKATELRQFLLYTGPIILKDILQKDNYLHFLSLSVAIRILADRHLHLKQNYCARSLLYWFVQNYYVLYGKKFLTYNVHNLLHLCDDVLKFGPLDQFSAFKFEDYMQKLKGKLQSAGKPLQQIANRIYEERKQQTKSLLRNVHIQSC